MGIAPGVSKSATDAINTWEIGGGMRWHWEIAGGKPFEAPSKFGTSQDKPALQRAQGSRRKGRRCAPGYKRSGITRQKGSPRLRRPLRPVEQPRVRRRFGDLLAGAGLSRRWPRRGSDPYRD